MRIRSSNVSPSLPSFRPMRRPIVGGFTPSNLGDLDDLFHGESQYLVGSAGAENENPEISRGRFLSLPLAGRFEAGIVGEFKPNAAWFPNHEVGLRPFP